MNTGNIDYETKIFIPTKELFQQLSSKAELLVEQGKGIALELHGKVSESSLEFYNSPVETATRWQNDLFDKANLLYIDFNHEILPAINSDYQLFIATVSDLGVKTEAAWQVFIDNPEKISLEFFSRLNEHITALFDESLTVSSTVLTDLSVQANKIIGVLMEKPLDTIETLYYDSLSALLNGYFEIVSSLLVV